MVHDKKKQEDFENGLIDPKTVELDALFKETINTSVKGSLQVIWDSMSYNFGKIRTRQHLNTGAIQKLMFAQTLTEHKIEEIKIRQGEFRPTVESHMKQDKERIIKTKAQWGLVSKILGFTGTGIVMVLALLQLFSILGG